MLSALAKENIVIFEGLVEVDETYFLESHKGRRVIANRKPKNAVVLLQKELFPMNKSVY